MPLRKSREDRHLRRRRAVVQSEHLSSSVGVGVLATEIGRKSGANFNMSLQRSLLQWMMQQASVVVLGRIVGLAILGCLAKLADELTGDFS